MNYRPVLVHVLFSIDEAITQASRFLVEKSTTVFKPDLTFDLRLLWLIARDFIICFVLFLNQVLFSLVWPWMTLTNLVLNVCFILQSHPGLFSPSLSPIGAIWNLTRLWPCNLVLKCMFISYSHHVQVSIHHVWTQSEKLKFDLTFDPKDAYLGGLGPPNNDLDQSGS